MPREKWNKADKEKAVQARVAAEEAMKDALTSKFRDEQDRLERYVTMAKTFHGTDPATIRGLAFQPHPGEQIFGGFRGELIEMRTAPLQNERRANPAGPALATSVRYRIVATRGSYLVAPDAPTAVEFGAVTVTDRRVVFQGPTEARQWEFSQLRGHVHHDRWPWTCIDSRDHQRPLGIATAPEQTADFRFALELALANHHGTVDALTVEFEQELADHVAAGPTLPPL